VIKTDDLCATFSGTFGGTTPSVLVRAPGRVNLIGEHTDYNDGYVLPIAMSQVLYVAARKRADRRVRVHTTAYNQTVEFELDGVGPPGEPKWANYVKGVAALLQAEGLGLAGADLLIDSEVPVGGGVSSSAALEVGTAKALLAVAGSDLAPVDLALLCRQAEHQYAASPCGIMDQFICVLGHKGHALLLDCRSRRYEHIPADLPGVVFVVMDTQVKHEIGRSEYPVRQRQCQEGLRQIQASEPAVRSLRDVDGMILTRYLAKMPTLAAKRCRHVVSEIERTVQAAEALKNGDVETFGRLMNASHLSLRDDYEVSCSELDALVEAVWPLDGVHGARMTGGGFGGCVIALVQENAVPRLVEAVRRDYDPRQAKPALVYTTHPAAGAEWWKT
jgi:galactokinase